MKHSKTIESIQIDRLIANPANPNRLNDVTFRKLLANIKRTGNYEPVIVRPHGDRPGCFEIINGHHRIKVLGQLGHKEADCVVWQVDDDEALVLLATLNRLGGSDNLRKKSELIKRLSRRFSSIKLSTLLSDSRKSIERLRNLEKLPALSGLRQKAFLNPMVFFLTDEQKKIVEEILAVAIDPGLKATTAQKRAWAIVEILREAKR